ncbi:hypothetical protein B0G57_101444 [Trinickia symbiotica]|nr:hypothetical protein B0G57_101444 [Trinickia symbiotica]
MPIIGNGTTKWNGFSISFSDEIFFAIRRKFAYSFRERLTYRFTVPFETT